MRHTRALDLNRRHIVCSGLAANMPGATLLLTMHGAWQGVLLRAHLGIHNVAASANLLASLSGSMQMDKRGARKKMRSRTSGLGVSWDIRVAPVV